MTGPPCRTDDPGGGVTGPGEAPLETLMRGPATAWLAHCPAACGRQVCMTWMRAYDANALAGTARTPFGRTAWTTSTTWASSSAWTSAGVPVTGTASPPAGKKVFDKHHHAGDGQPVRLVGHRVPGA